MSLNGILPAAGGVFSLMVRHFGFDQYREQLTGIAYSKRISSEISMAMQLDLIQSTIRGYGSQSTPTFEVGWLIHISNSWAMGFHCFNPLGKHRSDQLPFEAEWGVLFRPAPNISFYASLEKQTGKTVNQKIGFEYQHNRKLFLRLGFSTQPGLLTFGTGFRAFRNGFIDLASVAHLDLGLFSVITLKYDIKRKTA